MASTDKGIVYPTSGDSIAPLESHFASLAESVDEAVVILEGDITQNAEDIETLRDDIGVILKSGSFAFISPSSTTAPVNITVTLPGGHFTTPPSVVATVSGVSSSGSYFPVIHSTTTSQFQARVWRVTANDNLGTATVSIATPGVVTKAGHGLSNGSKVYFTTTGALPTGLLAGTVTTNNYFVRNAGTDTFNLSLSADGAIINTTGSQSGTHTLFRAAQEAIDLNWMAK